MWRCGLSTVIALILQICLQNITPLWISLNEFYSVSQESGFPVLTIFIPRGMSGAQLHPQAALTDFWPQKKAKENNASQTHVPDVMSANLT